jgi:hypothetical protein
MTQYWFEVTVDGGYIRELFYVAAPVSDFYFPWDSMV